MSPGTHMSQAKSVIQTMENTNMHLLVLFGMASCLLTALKGLLLNLGSISLEGGRHLHHNCRPLRKGCVPDPPAHLPSQAAEHGLAPSFRWPSFPWVSLFSRKQNMSLGLSLHLDPSPLLMGFKNAVLCCDCVPGE